MLSKERYAKIVELMNEKGAVTTSELIKMFQVSFETVRRDLSDLENRGVLQRVHGGAIPVDRMFSYSQELSDRLAENRDEKEELGETAALLVQDGDVVGIDSGSTAIYFARALKQRNTQFTVVTYSIDVFQILSQKEGIQIILCGGYYMKDEKAFYGQIAVDILKRLHIQKAFICPSAISLRTGVCDFAYSLYPLQLQMISSSDKVFFLANHEKFEKSGVLKICDMDPAYTYITDSGLNSQYKQLYQENNLNIISNKKDISPCDSRD